MRPSRRVISIFILLAILDGAVRTEASLRLSIDYPFSIALMGLVGGAVLLATCLRRRHRLPSARQWLALFLMSLPGWFLVLLAPPYVRVLPAAFYLPSGLAFLFTVASPLWLALLSALHLVRVEVPRAVSGAAIAALGAVCLIVPIEVETLGIAQAPALLLLLAAAVLTVYLWDYARVRLHGLNALAAAGASLLLGVLPSVLFALLLQHINGPDPGPYDWRAIAPALFVQGALLAAGTCLWFWLLTRLSLPAFCMNTFAAWTTSSFVFVSIRDWRADLAILIAVAAITVALRARLADEQPVALGLHRG